MTQSKALYAKEKIKLGNSPSCSGDLIPHRVPQRIPWEAAEAAAEGPSWITSGVR